MQKLYVQMYSFMGGEGYDNKENFTKAANMGFNGVELFGPNLAMEPSELKALLHILNLEAISMHAPETEKVQELIPFAKEMGLPFMGIGMHPMANDEQVHAFAKRLNELGEKCKEAGMTLVYHNHTQEFAPCEGKRIIDVLMDETDPEKVGFELDAGWCAAAGYDPIEFINEKAGRIKLVHIKESDKVIGPMPPFDFDAIPKDENGHPIFTEEMKREMEESKKINCPAGKGLVDWKKLEEAANKQGCQGYIVEREYTPEGYESREAVLAADVVYYMA